VDVPRRFGAGLEADEVRHRPLPEDRAEPEAGQEFHRVDRVHVHVPAHPAALAQRFGGEVAGGIADRLAHCSSFAIRRTSPIRRMPSSMR
jgi:hypothetical protein